MGVKATGGSNKERNAKMTAAVENIERVRLKALVDRIVRLEEEKKNLADDIKEVYTEAECNGYSKKALRVVAKLYASVDKLVDYNEMTKIIELYKTEVGLE